MKNKINLNQLSMSWNEKQKPQRLKRYAVMLIMLLTISVGQMWAYKWFVAGQESFLGYNWNDSKFQFSGSPLSVTVYNVPAGSYEFKIVRKNNDDSSVTWNGNGDQLINTISGTVTAKAISNNNMQITVSELSDITFTKTTGADVDTWTINVSGTATTGDVVYYFKNTHSWSNVYIYLYKDFNFSSAGNGASGSDAKVKASMTSIGDQGYYKYLYTLGSNEHKLYHQVCFNKNQQDNYGRFWDTDASWDDSYSPETPLWTPTSDYQTINSNVKYYEGAWSAPTWAMYSGATKIGDFTTTDGITYTLSNVTISSSNSSNIKYVWSGHSSTGEIGAVTTVVAKASARTITFDNGLVGWQDGDGNYDITIFTPDGGSTWKVYAVCNCSPLTTPTWNVAPANGTAGGATMTATINNVPDGATVTWSSNATSYATVSNSGVVSYVAEGSATISARIQKSESGGNCAMDVTLSQSITISAAAAFSWYWIEGNGAQNGSESVTKQQFVESATSGVYTLKRTITQNGTFHLGDGNDPYGPSSNTNVTTSSTGLSLSKMPPVYAYTFTPAEQPVLFTLNTNTMTLSLSNPTYTITLNGNGGTGHTSSVTATYGSSSLSSAITIPEKTGYRFDGWYDDSGGTGNLIISNLGALQANAGSYTDGNSKWINDDDVELYAKWTAKTYTVNLNQGDGSGGSSSVTATFGSAMPDATMPELDDYDFGGYFTSSGGSGTPYYNANGTSARSWDRDVNPSTLFAYWVPKATWYLIGNEFGDSWNTGCTSYPLNSRYRGLAGIYYREVTLGSNQMYFRIHNGTTEYGYPGNSKVDVVKDGDARAYTNDGQWQDYWYTGVSATVWMVVNTNSNNLWMMSPLKTVSVTSANGTVTMSATDAKTSQTVTGTQFASGETVSITVTPASGYRITSVSFNNETKEAISTVGNTKTYSVTMPNSNSTLVVTYEEIVPEWKMYDGATLLGTFTGTGPFTAIVNHTADNCNNQWFEKDGVAYQLPNHCQLTTLQTLTAGSAKYVWNTDAYGYYRITIYTPDGGTTWKVQATPVYAVTYNGNGESSGTVPTPQYYAVGETITTAAKGDLAKTNYIFVGWNTANDGNGQHYNESSSAGTMTIAGLNLYAEWEEDLRTGIYLCGTFHNGGNGDTGWDSDKREFMYQPGDVGGKYVTYTLEDLDPSDFTSNKLWIKVKTASGMQGNNGTYQFSNNDTYWQLGTGSGYDNNMGVSISVEGDYVFTFDRTNTQLKISYPIVNQLCIYTTTGSDAATIVDNYNWTQTAGVYSQALTLQAATTYTFKVLKNSVHYGNSTTMGAANKSISVSTGGGNISLTTTVAGTYTISYNPTTDQVSVSLSGETLTSVAVEYGWGLNTNVSVGEFTYPTITATLPDGMNFDTWTYTGTVTFGSATSSPTTITSATSGATVTATFNTTKVIYFDNTASKWDDSNGIWVYLFDNTDDVWWNDEVNGGVHPGVHRVEYGQMSRIGTSNIYYYRYTTNSTIRGVAYAKANQSGNTAFYQTSAAWLTDFNTCQPCYIASSNYVSKNSTGYHSTGYWKKYGTTDPGYSIWLKTGANDWEEFKFSNNDPYSFVYTASATLSSANSTYQYNLSRCAGGSLRRSGNQQIQPIDSDEGLRLDRYDGNGDLVTSSSGTYTFTLSLASDVIYMYTEYPLSVGDYRVVLRNGKDHPSGQIIRAKNESTTDTVSFFIDGTKSASNVLHIQKCTAVVPITWSEFDTPKTLALSGSPYTTTGIYNFAITRSNGNDAALSELENKNYTGDFYVRTDGADGKWTAYKTTPDNKLQYSAKSLETKAQFDYYFPKWINSGKNVQFTIANDYSPCISDTLYGDTHTGGADMAHQTLLADANVRFMWNSHTNALSRAYLDGATTPGSEFLVLHSENDKMYNLSGTKINAILFTDTKNWIYQADIQAKATAKASLTAEYNSETQDIIDDGEGAQQLIGGNAEDATLYRLRMVYDFKTNIMISAWLAETDQALGDNTLALETDMMIVRHGQDAAAQITFGTGKLTDVKTIYGALRFDYDDMVTHLDGWNSSTYPLLMYDISLPFDVNVKDVFGVGNMGDHWIIQKYNGAKRAEIGWFAETSTFWETLTETDVMHAYEGYTVIIDRPSFNSSTSVIWKNKEAGSSVYLYFPSADDRPKTISSGPTSITVPEHTCTNERTWTVEDKVLYHKITDSHWNMIGTPLFQDANAASVSPLTDDNGNTLNYYYAWNSSSNTYAVTPVAITNSMSKDPFKAMHGYMVQFAGTINFSGSYISDIASPALAARRIQSDDKRQIELQMVNVNGEHSRAYVELRENACDTFALNEDVYMLRSSKMADLYTYAGNYDVSANVLSIGNHIVPVGMDVKVAGLYTFTMPSEFSGSVVLIDTYTGARTNLALGDYEVNLTKGTLNDRFLLEINIHNAPTAIEGIEGGSLKDGKAHKFVQNGVMYILRDGKIYDARGAMVK